MELGDKLPAPIRSCHRIDLGEDRECLCVVVDDEAVGCETGNLHA